MNFDTTGMQTQDIKIRLERILPSLAKNLYGDDSRISIRELLQNCHDAISERLLKKIDLADLPRIDVIPDPSLGTLTFRDNGIGMTRDGVEKHLATIGASGKREEIDAMVEAGQLDRSSLDKIIGQYGIGFLSSFIIADKVAVLTRSRTSGSVGLRAMFTGETRWYFTDDSAAQSGTELQLKLKQAVIDPSTGKTNTVIELLNFEVLKREVRRFGDLLPYPIYVHRSPMDINGTLCNAIEGPWEKDPDDIRAIEEFFADRHPDENLPIAILPFEFRRERESVSAHGVVYFPSAPRKSSNEPLTRVELTSRRMFITDNLPALLPAWATFVGVLVECPDLAPTLSRNDVIRYDPAFVALKKALGGKIIEVLKYLAQNQPKTFSQLRGEHRDRLYDALRADFADSGEGEETFFRTIVEFMPFTVIQRSAPQGELMTLRKYRDAAKKLSTPQRSEALQKEIIYFLYDPVAMGQYRAMIVQRDIPVIQASYGEEPHLLQAYGHVFQKDVEVRDVKEILGDLYVDKVEQTPYESMKQFLSSLDGGGPDEVNAVGFEPNYVPAIVLVRSARDPNQAQLLERLLSEGGGVLTSRIRSAIEQDIRAAKGGEATVALVLNDTNPVIRSIRDYCVNNKLTGVVADVLHEIYHNARIYADPSLAESEHFFEHRNGLLNKLLQIEQALVMARQERDQLKLSARQAPGRMESRTCAMLLTDLRGSTTMIGFMSRREGAEILQAYAEEVGVIAQRYGGQIGGFTGDGIFAQFGLDGGDDAVKAANDCAFDVHGFTSRYFAQGTVANALVANGITITGSRTVLHWSEVMYGRIASAPAVVGPQVVAIFRACNKDELFAQYPIILTGPFVQKLQLATPPTPFAVNVILDGALPPASFYAHPALALAQTGRV